MPLILFIRLKHHTLVFQNIDNMIGHVDSHGIFLAVPLKIRYGIAENLPDIELAVELVFPLEPVNVTLAESDEVSLRTILSQT